MTTESISHWFADKWHALQDDDSAQDLIICLYTAMLLLVSLVIVCACGDQRSDRLQAFESGVRQSPSQCNNKADRPSQSSIGTNDECDSSSSSSCEQDSVRSCVTASRSQSFDRDRNETSIAMALSDEESSDDEHAISALQEVGGSAHRLFMEQRMREYVNSHLDLSELHKNRLLLAFGSVLEHLSQPMPPFRMIVQRLGETLQIDASELRWRQQQRRASRTSPYQERIAETQRFALDTAIAAALTSS